MDGFCAATESGKKKKAHKFLGESDKENDDAVEDAEDVSSAITEYSEEDQSSGAQKSYHEIPEREENTADEQGGSNAEEEELDEDEAMEREHKELESLGQKEANKFGDSENNQEEKEDKEKQEVPATAPTEAPTAAPSQPMTTVAPSGPPANTPIVCNTNDDCVNTNTPYCVQGYCAASPNGKKKLKRKEKSKKHGGKKKKGDKGEKEDKE